jgi:hypothetical protein
MQELKRNLVLAVAFIAFILAAYLQAGGTWRGPHNLRKSLPSRGATIGMQGGRYGCDGCYVSAGKLAGNRPPLTATIDQGLWLPHTSSVSPRSRTV